MGFRTGFAAILAISINFVAPANAETLADALTYAYNNSGLLDQNRALLRAADEDVAQAVADTLPIISWAANASRNSVSDATSAAATLSASYVFYDAGAGQMSVEAKKELVLGTRQALIDVEQTVLLDAVTAYMDVLSDTEYLALRQSNVRVITQELRAAQDRFDVGEVTRTDVALAEARLAAARSLLASAEGSLARSAEAYVAAVGRRPASLQEVTAAPVSQSLTEAKAYALRNHPRLLEAQHGVSAAELAIRIGEAAMSPEAKLTGRAVIDQDGNIASEIGVEVGGVIYAGGKLSSVVRKLMASRDQTRARLHLTAATIEQQVGSAYSFLEVARASIQAYNLQTKAARVAFDGVREEATLGARTTIDVLNAEQELLTAQADLISARSEEVKASYQVLATMGLMTAAHLRLPVQQYDPAAYYNLVKDAPTVTSDQGQALDRILKAIGQ